MKVLPDTNIWVHHLRYSDPTLCDILENGDLIMHPLVIGELALTDYPYRKPLIDDLRLSPMTYDISFEETLHFISSKTLYSRGIQWSDAVILASVLVTEGCLLWTRDRRLNIIARELGVSFDAD